MSHINVEIKAFVPNDRDDVSHMMAWLSNLPGYRHVGLDPQVDVYYEVPDGRLKMRHGSIEKCLIHYRRSDQAESKVSDVALVKLDGDALISMTTILERLGFKPSVVVNKRRTIVFVENVKFHFDDVDNLGRFIEIEAIQSDKVSTEEELRKQCDYYIKMLGIHKDELVKDSYSDMLLSKRAGGKLVQLLKDFEENKDFDPKEWLFCVDEDDEDILCFVSREYYAEHECCDDSTPIALAEYLMERHRLHESSESAFSLIRGNTKQVIQKLIEEGFEQRDILW